MSTFSISPLPGEALLRVRTVATRANTTVGAIYNAIRDGRMGAVTVDGQLFIAESESDRFIREWPTKARGVSARWAEFRQWKAARRAEPARAAV